MKNRYEYQVRAQCPVNRSDTDIYDFVIESDKMIPVERIVEFFAKHARQCRVFQEELTGLAAVRLGAKVTSTGVHSGVRVVCTAP